MDKKKARIRRATKTRSKIKRLDVVRLCINRSLQHIYAQIIDTAGNVLASASTVEKDARSNSMYGGNVVAASVVGKNIAERAIKAGVKRVAFDRSGFKYHGRVKALADAARAAGLDF